MRKQFELNRGENNVHSAQVKLQCCLEENYSTNYIRKRRDLKPVITVPISDIQNLLPTKEQTRETRDLRQTQTPVNEVIPNNILPYTQVSALSTCCQRCFSQQQMQASSETHSQSLFKERQRGEGRGRQRGRRGRHSQRESKLEVSIGSFPSGIGEPSGGGRDCGNQQEWKPPAKQGQ